MSRAHIATFSALAGVLAASAAPVSAQVESPPPAELTPPAGSLLTGSGVLVGGLLRVSGTLPSAELGSPVQVQRLVPDAGWVATASATTQAGGAFLARWRPNVAGRFTLRAVTLAAGSAHAATAAPTAQITVFRRARVTWYGPGFYGRRTACGQRMSRTLAGVAHRTLPCGTPVELFVDGRTATVPVVDRGPYTHGAHYDLTIATAKSLGVNVTRTIGVSPRRGDALVPPPLASIDPGTGGVPATPAPG